MSSDHVISAQDLEGVSITAAKEIPASIVIPIGNSQPLVTIHPDGRLEYGDGYEPDATARLFWEAVQRLQPTLEHRTGIKDVERKLRAGTLCDFLWRLEQSAGDAAAEKFLDDNPELRRLVDEAKEA